MYKILYKYYKYSKKKCFFDFPQNSILKIFLESQIEFQSNLLKVNVPTLGRTQQGIQWLRAYFPGTFAVVSCGRVALCCVPRATHGSVASVVKECWTSKTIVRFAYLLI